jgi:hypothetical protein
MTMTAVIDGIEHGERGWRVKLQVFPGNDDASEQRLHDGGPAFVYMRVPVSAGEARMWGAVVGATVLLRLMLDPHDQATVDGVAGMIRPLGIAGDSDDET